MTALSADAVGSDRAVKVLICGGWRYDHYEAACARGLEQLGVTVEQFSWSDYFTRDLLGKFEEKYVVAGPRTRAMNRALVRRVRDSKPDIVLVWRGTHVLPETLRRIRRMTAAPLVSYVNDDPFAPAYANGPLHQRRLWRLFHRAIPDYDEHLVYRPHNVRDVTERGARNARVFLPYFIPELHRPAELTPAERERFGCDAVFIGHYEADGREAALQALVDAGLEVRVFGGTWPEDVQRRLGVDVRPLLGDDYRKGLLGARMALCFLSRLNRDEYTRRCFEIPACGALLVSERTPALERMFDDGDEAVLFGSPEELVERALWLRANPDAAARIARRGRERVLRDGHDVTSRMAEFLEMFEPSRAS